MKSDFDRHADRMLCLFIVSLVIIAAVFFWLMYKDASEDVRVDGMVVEKGHVPEFYYISVRVDDETVYIIKEKDLYLDYDVGDQFNETLNGREIHEL